MKRLLSFLEFYLSLCSVLLSPFQLKQFYDSTFFFLLQVISDTAREQAKQKWLWL